MSGILTGGAAGLTVGAGTALALLFLLFLICTAKVRRGAPRRSTAAASGLDEVQRRLADLEANRIARVPEEADVVFAPPGAMPVSVRSGMNLSRRSQVLRLSRRGESPDQIAGVLGLATGEVRLLLKIHGILMEQARAGGHTGLKPGPDSADIPNSTDKAPARADWKPV